MVAYLTNARLTIATRIERLYELGGLEYLINSCARLDTRLNLRLDPGVVSSLEYEYSVTQSPPGDYRYVKWWDGGPILQADPRQKDESGSTWVAPISAKFMFPTFPEFLVPRLSPLPGFYGLTIFHQRGTKNTGYAWLSPC